jgi:MSHA biogenesis protein MshK
MNHVLKAGVALAALLSILHTQAQAQALADPTRPPAETMPAQAAGQPNASPVSSEPVLQSILTPHTGKGRARAIIDGQTVFVGDKFGDAVVAEIGGNEVVLRANGKRRVLELFPSGMRKKSTP